MVRFEKVSKYKDIDFPMPSRKTKDSAGYDMVVAKDTVIPSWFNLIDSMTETDSLMPKHPLTLNDIKARCKNAAAQPTLVSTGVKCYLKPGTYLALTVRSSTPLNSWLVLANGVGIIDADYADCEANEGEIFFQLINLSPYDILLKKGDVIGQGIIHRYLTTDDDNSKGERKGGFGSTSKKDYIGKRTQMNPVDEAVMINPLGFDNIKPIKVVLEGDNSGSGHNPLVSLGCSISDASSSIQAITSALENLNYNFEVGI